MSTDILCKWRDLVANDSYFVSNCIEKKSQNQSFQIVISKYSFKFLKVDSFEFCNYDIVITRTSIIILTFCSDVDPREESRLG
jgi:hypothetical protein